MTSPSEPSPSNYSYRRCFTTVAAWLFVVLLVFATLSDYGYAIDEASYLWVAREGRIWFSELGQHGWNQSFSREALADKWHFLEPPAARTGHSNFNLPLSMHLMNISWLFSHRFVDELTAHRLSSVLLFAIAVVATIHVLGGSQGWLAGLSLLAMPRVFGHAHLAATETPLCVFWLLTCLSLIRMTQSNTRAQAIRRASVVSLFLSATLAVKLTGGFLAVAILIWLCLFRPRGWLWGIGFSVLLPPIVIVLLTPVLWHDPVGGLVRYLQTSLDNPWQVATYYLGEGYLSRLPASSAFVLLAATTPVSTLVSSLIGIATTVRSPRMWAILMPTLALFGARAVGLVPTHDVDRQFLPVLYGIAVLAGFGIAQVVNWLTPSDASNLRQRTTILLVAVVALAEPAVDTWKYRGHGLSYYNRVIGGLAGASKLGLEVSYWYEAATDDVWHAILDDLPPGTRIFLRPDHPGLEDLRRWGVWRDDLVSTGPENADVEILYAKRSAYMLPVEGSDRLIPTDLGVIAERGPMDKEIRFDGVRMIGRRSLRGRPFP